MYKKLENPDVLIRLDKTLSKMSNMQLENLIKHILQVYSNQESVAYKSFYISQDKTYLTINNKKYAIFTPDVLGDAKRHLRNRVLSEKKEQNIKITGIVTDAKISLKRNTKNFFIFCLSPCIIDNERIDHMWVAYSQKFKGIKLGSKVSFTADVRDYSTKNRAKYGISWHNVHDIVIEGGDNSELHQLTIQMGTLHYAKHYYENTLKKVYPEIDAYTAFKQEISEVPAQIVLNFSEKKTAYCHRKKKTFMPFDKKSHFLDKNGNQIITQKKLYLTYHIINQEIVINEIFGVQLSKESHEIINKLILFEWLARKDTTPEAITSTHH